MKLEVNKVKKVTLPVFEKISMRGLMGIKCQQFGSLDFLIGNHLLKDSDFLHDGKGQ